MVGKYFSFSPGCPSGRERLWSRAQQASGEGRGPLWPGARPSLQRDLQQHQPRCGAEGKGLFPTISLPWGGFQTTPVSNIPFGVSLSLSQTRRSPFQPTRCLPASPSSPQGTASGLPARLRASGKARRPPPSFHDGSALYDEAAIPAGLHHSFPKGLRIWRVGEEGGFPLQRLWPGASPWRLDLPSKVFLPLCCSLPPDSSNSSLAPPMNVLQPARAHSTSAGPILAHLSRHASPSQVSGSAWTSGSRPPFTAQVILSPFGCSFFLCTPFPKKCDLGSRVRTPRPASSPADRWPLSLGGVLKIP